MCIEKGKEEKRKKREKEVTKHNIRIDLGGSLKLRNILWNPVLSYTRNREGKKMGFLLLPTLHMIQITPNKRTMVMVGLWLKAKTFTFIFTIFMDKMNVIFIDSGS